MDNAFDAPLFYLVKHVYEDFNEGVEEFGF